MNFRFVDCPNIRVAGLVPGYRSRDATTVRACGACDSAGVLLDCLTLWWSSLAREVAQLADRVHLVTAGSAVSIKRLEAP